ncbi:HelD family protein [Deinococcus ficus]|nr:AAA family ATPase [Deinococcus ficus]
MTHPDHAAEATHLEGTVKAMLRQIEAWEDRDRNAGADLETSLTLADTAEELAAVLSPHVHAPYFGRMQVNIGGRTQALYIGKHAFQDLKGPHHVVSWESDVGGLFYQTRTEWTTPTRLRGTVLHKRQLDVRDKTLLRVSDLYDARAGGETGAREQVLIERLGEASTTGMRDVVQTLQPEQNDAVRLDAGRNCVIQGAAGSGKTTIGFHRLAWMAHPERRQHQADAAHCMVLMPNEILADYSRKVLPGLGLDAVTVTTPERWALGFLGVEKMTLEDRTLHLLLTDRDTTRRKQAWLRAKALGSARIEEVLRRHLRDRLQGNARATHLEQRSEYLGRTVTYRIDPPALALLIAQTVQVDSRLGYRHELTRQLHAHFAAQSGADAGDAAAQATWQDLLGRVLRQVFLGLQPVTETRRLLADPQRLQAIGADLLTRHQLHALTLDPLAGVPRARTASIDVVELPAILTCYALLSGIGRREGRALHEYAHVVLDEGQDYSPLMYRMMARATRPGHISVLGDLNQGLHGYKGPNDWREVEQVLGGAQVATLTRTYRSTREITAVAAQIAQTYNRSGSPVVGVDRSGEAVRRSEGLGLQGLAGEVRSLLAAGHRNIALVTRNVLEADRLSPALRLHDVDAQPITTEQCRYRGGVVVLPVHYAKGLEFDACVAVNADNDHYDPAVEYERRLLYVTVSRGLHALSLHAPGALHDLLKPPPPLHPVLA